MCEGDNLNCGLALLWAESQEERAGAIAVPFSAGLCIYLCRVWVKQGLHYETETEE